MKSFLPIVAFAVAIIGLSFRSEAAIPISIRADSSSGHGFTVLRESECYVIAPSHVIPQHAQGITLIGPQGSSSTATVVRRYEDDIVILRASGGNSLCQGDTRAT